MAYEGIKLASIISFWLIMIIFGLIPLCLRKIKNINIILSLINCFTAGLFLATGLIHILPESSELFSKEDSHGEELETHGLEDDHGHEDEHENEGHSHGISYSHLILLLAFSFILFIEKVLLNRSKKKKTEMKSIKTEELILMNTNRETIMKEFKNDEQENNEYLETHSNQPVSNTLNHISKNNSDHFQNIESTNKINYSEQNIELKNQSQDLTKKEENLKKNHTHQEHSHGHDHDHDHDHMDIDEKSSILSVIVTLFALGIHAFMANLAVGIEDNKDTLITLIITIALHKWSEGLALGIILVKKSFSNLKKILIVLFVSIFTPLGGLVGYFLEESNNTVKGVFLAISAGAFVYIAILEIIFEEFKSAEFKYPKFILYCLGVGVVMLLFAVN